MKQIYTNTTERVYLELFQNGVPVNATTTPTFSISRVGDASAPRTGTAISDTTGVYYFVTTLAEASYQATLKVVWDYNVGGNSGARIDFIKVITPYVSTFDIKEIAPVGTSAIELEHAETFSRFIINAYTGVEFAESLKTINMDGNGQKTLVLPNRIERLDSIAVNDEVLWTRSPEVNQIGRKITISDTNYGLLSESQGDVPTADVDTIGDYGWKKTRKYTLSGLFGWSNIPDEVEYCAKLLADDYFCKETAWKKRYVNQINASDWRIVFNTKQYQNSTGNYYADMILQNYKSIGMVIV